MNKNLIISTLLVASLSAFPVCAKNDKGNKGAKGKNVTHGLQKKISRGKPLPPGWEKRLAKGNLLGKDIFEAGKVIVPVDNKGIMTIKVEGKAIKLFKATREIVDILE
jgi:hypothetical protein